METHDECYTDADKVSILAESMKCEDARQTVLSCQTAGYTAAMEELRATYGRRIIIYPMLVEQLTKKQKHDYSYDGVKEMIMRTNKVLMEIDEIGGKHIETLAVALAVRDMDTELKKEWLRQLKCDDRLSTLSDLKDFAVPLMHNLEKRKHYSHTVSSHGRRSCPLTTVHQPSQHPESPPKKGEFVQFAKIDHILLIIVGNSKKQQLLRDSIGSDSTNCATTVCIIPTLLADCTSHTSAGIVKKNTIIYCTKMKRVLEMSYSMRIIMSRRVSSTLHWLYSNIMATAFLQELHLMEDQLTPSSLKQLLKT